MTDFDVEKRAWDIAIEFAADDKNLRKVLGAIVLPNTVKQPDEDYDEMREYLFHRYGLYTPDHFEAVFSRCEEKILSGQFDEA